MPDEDREREPPDPIPNSEVKPFIADGSVGSPHVRVGHRQASNQNPAWETRRGFFIHHVAMQIEYLPMLIFHYINGLIF